MTNAQVDQLWWIVWGVGMMTAGMLLAVMLALVAIFLEIRRLRKHAQSIEQRQRGG